MCFSPRVGECHGRQLVALMVQQGDAYPKCKRLGVQVFPGAYNFLAC